MGATAGSSAGDVASRVSRLITVLPNDAILKARACLPVATVRAQNICMDPGGLARSQRCPRAGSLPWLDRKPQCTQGGQARLPNALPLRGRQAVLLGEEGESGVIEALPAGVCHRVTSAELTSGTSVDWLQSAFLNPSETMQIYVLLG